MGGICKTVNNNKKQLFPSQSYLYTNVGSQINLKVQPQESGLSTEFMGQCCYLITEKVLVKNLEESSFSKEPRS